MSTLIKNRSVVADDWQRLAADAALPTAGNWLFPLAAWTAARNELAAGVACGLWLESDDELTGIIGDLARFAVIAINFPKFADGRGYSLARLLRERLCYRGELRAIGDVLPDQIFYLQRVGFDAFALRADKKPEHALAALDTFDQTYQAASDQPLPLFRRRSAA
jgi:uncharacterized protein (DUF934 family)